MTKLLCVIEESTPDEDPILNKLYPLLREHGYTLERNGAGDLGWIFGRFLTFVMPDEEDA